jgi:hypothetical protein
MRLPIVLSQVLSHVEVRCTMPKKKDEQGYWDCWVGPMLWKRYLGKGERLALPRLPSVFGRSYVVGRLYAVGKSSAVGRSYVVGRSSVVDRSYVVGRSIVVDRSSVVGRR